MQKKIVVGLFILVVVVTSGWFLSRTAFFSQLAAILSGNKSETASTDNDFVLGDPSAPVTIVEYASHFCGHCVSFQEDILPLLIEKYVTTGKVKIVSRMLSSLEVNNGLFCAGEQGKFFEFNDYLFKHISGLSSVEGLKTMAGALGLDQDQFDKCFDENKYKSSAQGWYDKAKQDKVSGTPSFLINGKLIVGNKPFVIFQTAIDEALAGVGTK